MQRYWEIPLMPQKPTISKDQLFFELSGKGVLKGRVHDEETVTSNKRRLAQTLRLNQAANLQLARLALNQTEIRGTKTYQHDLIVEAVNDLFKKYCLPQIA
jgi:hypothetical protein